MSKNRIKELRLEKGITQNELAELIGVTQSYVAKLENGSIGLDIDLLPVVSKALKCKPYELLPIECQPQITEEDLKLLNAIKSFTANKENEEKAQNTQKQKENQR